MPEGKSTPSEPPKTDTPPSVAEQSTRAFKGLRNLAERITPLLVDVGSWIFGGLIAANLVVLSALVTVGPVDVAIRTSTAVLAAALPLNVAGIVLLRLIKDVNDVGLDDVSLRAFHEAGFPDIEAYFPLPHERAALRVRRSNVALLYSLGIATSTSALTVTGMIAAMWHMGRWIGCLLLGAVLVSVALIGIVIAHTLPPVSDREKSARIRYAQRSSSSHSFK